MSKIRISSKLYKDNDRFDEFLERLGNLTDGIANAAQEASLWDAQEVAKDLNIRYTEYVNNLSSYDRTKSNSTRVNIDSIKNGYSISMSGPELIYQEFGTGQRGIERPYPDESEMKKAGYKYLDGRKILHEGKYLHDRRLKVPVWYKNAIEKYESVNTDDGKGINPQDYVWMSPHGITHGLEPGRFWYDTWYDYEEGEYELEESEMDYSSKFKLNGAHFKLVINNILDGKGK